MPSVIKISPPYIFFLYDKSIAPKQQRQNNNTKTTTPKQQHQNNNNLNITFLPPRSPKAQMKSF
jgi:hypothetical protein